MNTNVGNMPLDIFADYISDYLGVDFPWEYIVVISNGAGYEYGAGDIPAAYFRLNNSIAGCGYGYGRDFGYGSGGHARPIFGYGYGIMRRDFSEVDRGCGGNNGDGYSDSYTGCG